MILALSGPPGSGKSTIAEMLAEKLGFKRYYMGGLQREMANTKGMTIEEHNTECAKNPKVDKEIDEYVKKLGEEKDDFIIESRTAFHFIPHAIKIYVTVDAEEGARRILGDTKEALRNEDVTKNVTEKVEHIKKRMANETERYKKYYGIDCHNPRLHDIIIDTTDITAEKATENILKIIKEEYS